MTTGLVWEERLMWHDTGMYFGPADVSPWIEPIQPPENADGKRRIKNLFDRAGLTKKLTALSCLPASEEDVLRVHTAKYFAEVQELSEKGGGNLGLIGSTQVGNKGIDIALLSAGGAISATKAILSGKVDNAYALIRPPGHHARPNEAMGFCVFANAAIAGLYALEIGGLDRIAFVDWDVHHGNGTQEIFWEDPRALTISLHQENCFPPASGATNEIGAAQGFGTNLNIPLPPGCGEAAYLTAFDHVVLPALETFNPQLIIVPCGFDAGFHDPLGRMMLTSHSFRLLAARIKVASHSICDGKIVMTHEGGYSPHSVPFHCLAVLEELSGIQTNVLDPYLKPSQETTDKLLPHQADAISRAEGVLKEYIL
ncbi:MAG: class II histone deacetylase [Rhodospirillales bacterium]|nr:class II histone deacetylase [Rhodospirillales bacterium]